jgi:NADPH:quinone reductase-like Zn-dependent oxidoreductase
MPHRLAMTGKSVVEWTEFELEPLPVDRIHMKSRASLISPGTEGIILHQKYEPGSHYDQFVKLPYHLGYCMVGEVYAVGSDVADVKIGQRAFYRRGHGSDHYLSQKDLCFIPKEVSDDVAIWSALAMVGSMVLNAGTISLLDDVLIIGGGPIGQMALRWCVSAGARCAMIDPSSERLEIAKKGGAKFVLQGTAIDGVNFSKLSFGCQPRVVIDTTGIPAVFELALKIPANYGTLVLLGDTGKPSEQRLTPDVVIRGIKIHGAHITHEMQNWTEKIAYHKFYELVLSGAFKMDGMNTHRYLPAEGPTAYKLLAESPSETMGVWFDWKS